jgi:hypothetical protein
MFINKIEPIICSNIFYTSILGPFVGIREVDCYPVMFMSVHGEICEDH